MPRYIGVGALLLVLTLALAVSGQQHSQVGTILGGAEPTKMRLVPIDIKKATQAYYASRVIGQKQPLAILSMLSKLTHPTWPFKSNQPKVVTLPMQQTKKN